MCFKSMGLWASVSPWSQLPKQLIVEMHINYKSFCSCVFFEKQYRQPPRGVSWIMLIAYEQMLFDKL